VTQSQLLRVVLWMTGTLVSFSVMAVSVRELAGQFSIFEILTIRSGLGLILTVLVGLTQPALFRSMQPRRLPLHFVRNSTHFVAQYLWSISLTLLPLATVFALEFTMPAWTALLAGLFLGETLTRNRLGAVACGAIGVLLILRPGLDAFQPAALLVLAAAFGYALSNIATKKLTTAGETTFAIVLWMNIMQLPFGYLGSDPLFFLKIDSSNLIAVAAIGISGLTAHYCLTNALAAGEATVVIPLDFMRLPLIALVGWTFYGEALDMLVFVGGAVIIAGVLWNLKSETQRSPKSASGAPPAPRSGVGAAHDG
jgi:drug/metabolite transporter (DMT)-like permease